MWLNGFNDNVPGYPKVTCEMVKCPDPYMGPDQPGDSVLCCVMLCYVMLCDVIL